KPDADILWFNLHQFAQRVLQPPADRDRAADGRIQVWKLLAPDRARGIVTGAGFVHDDIGQIWAALGNQFRDDFFRFATAGPIANADYGKAVLAPQFIDDLFRLVAFGGR